MALSTPCEQYTAPRTLRTRIFSRAWLKARVAAFFCGLRNTHPRAHVMLHALLASSALSAPTSSSVLCPPNSTNPCAPQTRLLFGRVAEQSPLAGNEPNARGEQYRGCDGLTLQGKQALARRTTLPRTSSPLLVYRRWMKDQIWECWPHRC